MSENILPLQADQNICLYRLHQKELDHLFASLPGVPANALSGPYRGRVFGFTGFAWAPRWLMRILFRLLETPINPWRGKSFTAGMGANLWFRARHGLVFARFRVCVDKQQKITEFNYDLPDNASWLRGMRGEVRQWRNNSYLARMSYSIKGKPQKILYFSLVPAE